MKNHKYLFFVSLLTALILSSCGEKGGSKMPVNVIKENKLESEMRGVYQALLSPVNESLVKGLTGSLTLTREREELITGLRFSGGPSNILQVQNIHTGSRCPTKADDLNQDNIIDAQEGSRVYGTIILPLDGDLNAQHLGLGTFPMSDEYGYYFYSQVATWDKFITDLHEEDLNLDDDLVKLPKKDTFMPSGKVVVIYGIQDEVPLPDTVASRGRVSLHQSLPIACGVIQKLGNVPGVIDDDSTDLPYPGGETIGGSGGGDDGADFSANSSGGTTSGNYGEEEEESEAL